MSFKKFNEEDLISTVYTAHPNYRLTLAGPLDSVLNSEYFYVFNSSSIGRSRVFTNLEGISVTGSYNLSGAISYIPNTELSTPERKSLDIMKNIYASSSFIKTENYTSSSIFHPTININSYINIPQVLYGSEIKPGSLFIQASNYEYNDDAHGGVYSGSLHVGCVFYQHGIVLLGRSFATLALSSFVVSFSGTMKMPMNIYLCQIKSGEYNFTENSSYTNYLTSSGKYEITTKQPSTFITGINLYDEDFKLLGVAKISTPILNEESTNILFKLKLTF